MTAMIRHPARGLTLLLLDCGCWVEASDRSLEVFRDTFGLDAEALTARIQAQHTHRGRARALRVDIVRSALHRLDPEVHGVWPDRDSKDRRTTLRVSRGTAVPLSPCRPEQRS